MEALKTEGLPEVGKNGLTTILTHNIDFDEETKILKTQLKSSENIAIVNIYKALCKIAIGVIDDKELPSLKETVKWIISSNEKMQKLPKVASLVEYTMFAEVPKINLYVRKGSDTNLPHVVGEFKFKCFIYVFVLPFSLKDDKDFSISENYEFFWNFFKHYSKINGWKFHDFSSTKSVPFVFNLRIEPNTKI